MSDEPGHGANPFASVANHVAPPSKVVKANMSIAPAAVDTTPAPPAHRKEDGHATVRGVESCVNRTSIEHAGGTFVMLHPVMLAVGASVK